MHRRATCLPALRPRLLVAAVCIASLISVSLSSRCALGFSIAQDGRALVSIYIQAGDGEEVTLAAQELTTVLTRMVGAKFAVLTAAAPAEVDRTQPAIVLGTLAEGLGLKMERTSRARDGFRCKVVGPQLLIVGESPRGVLYGVYDLLETLGCGWYTVGELGEVIPARPTIAVPDDLEHSEISDSISRRLWYGGGGGGSGLETWLRRNKCGHVTGSWSHAWAGLVPPKEYFDQHPEYFSLNKGQRTPKQLCTTNRDTIRIAAESLMKRMEQGDLQVYSVGPNDGGNLCECEECVKLDTPEYVEPSSGLLACSDRVFKFAHDVAEITSKRFPDKALGVYIYSEYSRTPIKLNAIHPNVFPMFAPIRRCRLHGPGNPTCYWNKLWQDEIRQWAQMTPKLGFYIYNYNLADTLVPLGKIDFYRRLADEVRRLNIQELAWDFESMDSWATHAPHMYLSARLSWNTDLDIDAEMDRFFNGFYGEAAEPMRTYWLRIDDAYATTNTHTGSQYGLHHIWTDELLAASRQDIEQAKRLAQSPRVKEAVAMAEAGLRCAELFIRIRKAMVSFDFLEAEKAQDELKAHIAMMAAKPEPHWANQRYAWGYYATFTGRTVTGGAEVLKNGGTILVKFPDVWKFQTDEEGKGLDNGWQKPEFNDADWEDFATFSKSWDDQGLGWYHGDAWYRTRFSVPAAAKGQDLRLWFGGFDYNADVYLNGVSLGEQRGFARPCEWPGIANHLRFGAENVLAVRVSAGDLAEIGTGGIMMPVMIYAAKSG